MKQHITFKELDELSDKGKERLLDFLWQRMKDSEKKVLTRSEVRLTDGVLLSIGQMIEFLDEKGMLESETGFDKYISWTIDTNCCDTLWETCKEVLEK